jgi:ABC-type multidrug transport system permease subunit
MALIGNPKFVLLDEPTSGLDSFQALSVINTLKELTREGITIIISIHQPSSIIMNLIDNIILISEGQIVYCGPTDRASYYFGDIGFQMGNNFNPADFYLDLIALNYTSTELLEESKSRLNYFVTKWNEIRPKDKIGYYAMERPNIIQKNNKNSLSLVKYLGWRSIKQSSRNTFALKIKIFTNIFFALVLGGIYSDSKSVQDIIGVLFFIAINQSFGNTMGIINIFIHEKRIIQKEIDSNAYTLLPYYITKIITEIPFTILPPLLFGIINYWVVGLDPNIWKFLIFLLQITIESITAMSMGIFISSISSSIEIATTIAPILNILFFLFAGLFININSLPKVLRFFPYISFIKWSFQALVLNQYKGNEEVIETYCHENRSISNSIGFVALIGFSFLVFGYIGLVLGKQKYIHLS